MLPALGDSSTTEALEPAQPLEAVPLLLVPCWKGQGASCLGHRCRVTRKLQRYLTKPFHISKSFFQKGWESWILTRKHMAKWEKSPGACIWQGLAKRVSYLNDWLFTKFKRAKNRNQNASWNDFKYTSNPFLPQFDHLLGKCKASLHISSAGIAGRGECNNDIHLDIGDPKSGVSPILDFQHRKVAAFTWPVYCSMFLGQVCLCTWQKGFCFKSGRIMEFSRDTVTASIWFYVTCLRSYLQACSFFHPWLQQTSGFLVTFCWAQTQPPIRVTGTRAKLRVWRPRPSSAEAFLAFAWNIHSQPPNHGPC